MEKTGDNIKNLQRITQSFTVRINRENGDFIGSDGLVYCGRCRTPKQCRINLMGIECTPPCLCRCEQEKDNAVKKQLEHQRIVSNRNAAFSDAEMKNASFANDKKYDPYASDVARKYAENFQEMLEKGQGLLFFGGTGRGKSFLSACILNSILEKGYSGMMTDFPSIINAVSETFEKQSYIQSFNNYSLVIFDDLFAERSTDYASEIVYNVINSRYRAKLPTIFTTNLTAKELKSPVNVRQERILSRLYAMCNFFEVKGQDHRREIMAGNFSQMNETFRR